MFGETTLVKLDLFHAIKRIWSWCTKYDSVKREVSAQLWQVFKEIGDQRVEHACQTPEINQMLAQFDAFAQSVDPHLNAASRNALFNLRKHISTGCLNEISPSFGTNHNKRLHQVLLPILFLWYCEKGSGVCILSTVPKTQPLSDIPEENLTE